MEELPLIIKKALKIDFNSSDLVKFVNYLDQNSFDFDRVGYFTDLNNYFYYVGFADEVKVNNTKMNDFLTKYEQSFKKLAEYHDKKIKESDLKT